MRNSAKSSVADRGGAFTRGAAFTRGFTVLTGFFPISAAAPIHLYRQMPFGNSRVCRVTQLRTDGVHCRESADTGPVVFKVVPVTGAAILRVTTNQIMCAALFPLPLLV